MSKRKKFKNRFKVSKFLRRYVKCILITGEIPHKFTCEDGQWYCETNISGTKFHKIVQRAICEKKTKEDGLFYLTHRESEDLSLSQALLERFGRNGYVVLGTKRE